MLCYGWNEGLDKRCRLQAPGFRLAACNLQFVAIFYFNALPYI
jgi:hypothetical protein